VSASTISASKRRRGLMISLLFMLAISFGSLFATISAGWTPKLGLDLAGGTEVVLTPAKGRTISAPQLAIAEEIIRKRVAGIGVSGATVQIQGSQIIVQVPGVHNGRHIDNILVTTSQLLFRPVECGAPAFVQPAHGKAPNPLKIPPCSPGFLTNLANLRVTVNPAAPQGYTSNPNLPADPQFAKYPSINAYIDALPQVPSKSVIEDGAPGSGPYPRYVLFPAVMTGRAVASASATQDQLGAWLVQCNLTSQGSAQWDAVVKQYFHTMMAIELDAQVVSAPILYPSQSSPTSSGGQVQISGNLTQANANQIAQALTYGSLPVPMTILTSDTVSPTLGHAALVAGLGAGLAGLVLVLLYVLFYYRLLGAVVLSGLAVTAAILWALISALGQTSVAPSFDLAGVTGLIVSIGITTDSYIVYFERLKDETRSGRTVRTSLDRGFASAWRTVLAADTVSLLAAVLLFFLAAGSVRGFAFFLGLSTLLDVIVTWFFTRPAVNLLARNERLTSLRHIGVASGLGAAARAGAPA
jgi:preprotein translocase subunit SecD